MWPEWRLAIGDGRVLVISMHAAAVGVAVLVGTWWAVRGRAERAGLVLVALAVAVAGLVGAHAAFVLLGGKGALVGWSGGLASMGGVAAGLATGALGACLLGLGVWATLDAIVPAGLLALGIGRIGCFLGGCCYGLPSDLPWAVVFPELGAPARHPLQLYSAAVDVAIVGTFGRVRGAPGARARRTLAAFAIARVLLEVLRDDATTDRLVGGVTVPQATCIALVLGLCVTMRGPTE